MTTYTPNVVPGAGWPRFAPRHAISDILRYWSEVLGPDASIIKIWISPSKGFIETTRGGFTWYGGDAK